MGSGFGSVGRTVAANTRGPYFESSNRRNFIMSIFTVNENNKKQAWNGSIVRKKLTSQMDRDDGDGGRDEDVEDDLRDDGLLERKHPASEMIFLNKKKNYILSF